MSDIVVRHAQPDDWPAVAELLTELGRGVARGTADDTTHRLQFAGHIWQIEHITLVAESAGDVLGVIDMEYHQRLGDHRPQARVNEPRRHRARTRQRNRHRAAHPRRGAGAQARLFPHGARDRPVA